MRSPRKLRPDTITVFTSMPENDEGVAWHQRTVFKIVRYDGNYGINQSQRGIDDKNTVCIVIDMNDLDITNSFGDKLTSFNFEEVFIKGKTYIAEGILEEFDFNKCVMVNQIKPLHALSKKIEFLEVYCS